jgi:putative ABC transport system permease protein
VIGSLIFLNGKSVKVVGIAPEGFSGTDLGSRRELWFSLRSYAPIARGAIASLTGEQNRTQRWLTVIGRLAPGVTLARAQSILSTTARNLAAAYPKSNGQLGVRVLPLTQAVLGQGMRPKILSFTARLMAVVALVLAVAAVNVAGLLLARGLTRRREIAVRLSLGASRGRLVRQLFVEGLLLGFLGLVVGVFLAKASLPLIEKLKLPSDLPLHGSRYRGAYWASRFSSPWRAALSSPSCRQFRQCARRSCRRFEGRHREETCFALDLARSL